MASQAIKDALAALDALFDDVLPAQHHAVPLGQGVGEVAAVRDYCKATGATVRDGDSVVLIRQF